MPNNGKDPVLRFAELLARLSDDVVQFSAAVNDTLHLLQEQQNLQDERIAKLEGKIAEREAVEAGETH